MVGPEGLSSQRFLRLRGTVRDLEGLGPVTILGRPGAPADEIGVITEAMTHDELSKRLNGTAPLSAMRVLDESADLA